MGAVTFATRRPAGAFDQLCIGGGFIDKNRPRYGLVEESVAPVDPHVALGSGRPAWLLTGGQAFFYESDRADAADERHWNDG